MEEMAKQIVAVSTVTPVFAGSSYLADLVLALDAERQKLEAGEFPLRLVEAIFVLDDPKDESAEVLRDLAQQHDWIWVITLSRNFGQHLATIAGVLHTSGDWVVTLDEDLQHHPMHIVPMILSGVSTASDIVYGQSSSSVHNQGFRNWSSGAAKRLIAALTTNANVQMFSSFRALRGSVARAAASLASHSTYLDVALSWFSTRAVAHRVEMKDPRVQASGYSLSGLVDHAWRLFQSSNPKGLRVGSLLGLATVVISMLGAVAVLFLRLYVPESIAIQGWASLMIVIFFFGGLASLLATLALDYLISLHQGSVGKPAFFVVDRSSDERLRGMLGKPW
jgi:glycosyltransferase involved in cell wall biosynthesis